MKKALRLVLFMFLAGITACNNSSTETSVTADTAVSEGAVDKKEEAPAALNFTLKDYKQQLTPGCDSCPQVTASIPVATGNEAITQKINSAILDVLARAIGEDKKQYSGYDSLFTGFINSYKKMKADLPDAHIGWEANLKGSVVQHSDSLINIKLESFVFTGGAHPNTNTFSLLFDPKTGNRLSIVNLVSNFHKLIPLAETKFREQYKIPAKASINSTGFMFDKDKFVLPENIFLSDDGLLLHYNAYEAAPYVMGPQEVLLPYAEVKPYLQLH